MSDFLSSLATPHAPLVIPQVVALLVRRSVLVFVMALAGWWTRDQKWNQHHYANQKADAELKMRQSMACTRKSRLAIDAVAL
eukprot:IDg3550t1